MQSHKGIKFTRFTTHRSQKQGGTMTQEKGIPPSQVMSEQEIESMVAHITQEVLRVEVTN